MNSVGKQFQRTVSVFLFCMCFTSGMHHSFVWLQCQPWRMVAHVTVTFVLFAL
jgi:hypothetical protein